MTGQRTPLSGCALTSNAGAVWLRFNSAALMRVKTSITVSSFVWHFLAISAAANCSSKYKRKILSNAA